MTKEDVKLILKKKENEEIFINFLKTRDNNGKSSEINGLNVEKISTEIDEYSVVLIVRVNNLFFKIKGHLDSWGSHEECESGRINWGQSMGDFTEWEKQCKEVWPFPKTLIVFVDESGEEYIYTNKKTNLDRD